MPQSKSRKAAIRRRERIKQAWELRVKGYGLKQIAKECGVSVTQACRDVQDAYADWREECAQESAEAARLDLARIDKILTCLMPAIEKGCHKSAAVARGYLDRRAKIYGYDAITRIEVSTGEDSLEELKTKIQEALESK